MDSTTNFQKDIQFYKFCGYGFLKNLKFFAPFFLLFLKSKDISFLDIGVLYAIRETVIYLTEIPSGMLADAMGRKKTMVTSFGFYIISFLLFYFFSGFWLFALAMLLFAFGDSFRTGTHKAMIFEYLKIKGWEQHKVAYYGRTRACSQFGSAISSLLAVVIIFFAKDYNAIFLFSTIPYILDGLLILSYPKELDGKMKTTGTSNKANFKQIFRSLASTFRQKEKIRILLNVSSFSGFFKVSKDYLQIIIQYFALSVPLGLAITQKQETALFVGVIFFLLYLLTSMASRHSGKIKNIFGSSEKTLNILLISGILLGITSGILFHFGFYLLSLLSFMLIYINENFRKPVGVSYISEKFDSETLATTLSVESLTNTLIGSLMALLIGALADFLDIGLALVIISGIFLLLSGMIWIREKD
ncbi:MAG: MFS transporter [Bacteroidales bacterium]|nr:MFS transporter [Bacteroidales bacterium]